MNSIKKNVDSRLMQQLFTQGIGGTLFNIFAAGYIFLYFALSYPNDWYTLHLWFGGIVLSNLFRLIIAQFGRKEHNLSKLDRWYFLFAFFVFCNGLFWCSLYPLFISELDDFHRLFISLMMLGGVTISILSMSPSLLSFYSFAIPVTIPMLYINFMQQNFHYYFFLLGIGLYLSFIFYLFHRNRQNLLHNYVLLIRQDELIEDLHKMNNKLLALSITDSLTKLHNRGYFSERLTHDWARCKRAQLPLSILIIDIDLFKEYNDIYGHLKGDQCLQAVAEILRDNLPRITDLAARFGGDEMAVILYNTDAAGAKLVASKILKAIQDLQMEHRGSPMAQLSVSIGIASLVPQKSQQEENLLAFADQALYFAKEHGRNRLKSYDDFPHSRQKNGTILSS